MAVLIETIEWPNGRGHTPCSVAYKAALEEKDRIKPEGNGVSLDSLSPEEYQRWNVLDNELLSMQADGGHLGKSVCY